MIRHNNEGRITINRRAFLAALVLGFAVLCSDAPPSAAPVGEEITFRLRTSHALPTRASWSAVARKNRGFFGAFWKTVEVIVSRT